MTVSRRAKYVLLTCGFILGVLFISWISGAWDSTQDGSTELRPVLLLAGDSLTEKGTNPTTKGWVTMLQNVYTRSADVVPRGLSGYNTRWYLKYAIPTLKKEINHGVYTPVFITVWLGANDAALPNGGSYKQHVPKETYKANLVKIAHAFKEMAPDAEILLITPPHIDDNARLKLAEQNNRSVDRTNAMTGTYAQACAEAAELLDVRVLDLHSYFNNISESERNNLLEDGLHLNSKGNELMFQQLQKAMSGNFTNVVNKLWSWQLPAFEKWVEDDPWIPDGEDDESSDITDTSTR